MPSLSETREKYKQFFSAVCDFIRRTDLFKLSFALIIIAVLYYVLLFSVYSILLQETFWTQAFDSGIDDQGIWLLSRFLVPFVTVRGLNIFADSITLYHLFLAPLFWFCNHINILYIVQTIFIALGAIPLFIFAKERLKSSLLALVVALSFLLYPALQNLSLDQYHSEAVAVFFVILTLYYLLKKNFRLFYIFLFISLIGKDEIAATTVFIGFFLLFFQKEYKHGLITSGISLGWCLLCGRIFAPIFNGVGVFASQPLTYSHWFQGLMHNLFNPAYYLSAFFHPESLIYYLQLLAPLAFIPLFSAKFLFLLFPSVMVNVLSGTGYLRSVFYHYNYVQSAVIFFGLIEGLYYFKNKTFTLRLLNRGKTLWLGVILLGASIAGNIILSNLPLHNQWERIADKIKTLNSSSVKIKQAAIHLIPEGAKVSASYSIVPHLSHRREIYMFPNPFKSVLWGQWFQEGLGAPPALPHVDYVMVDLGNHDEEEQRIIRYLADSAYFKTIYRKGPIFVLQRENKQLQAGEGANYTLYADQEKTAVTDDFAKELKIKKTGRVAMLYFPDSKYYFRNLLGEEILAGPNMALQFSGYFFVPEGGEYRFVLQSAAETLMEVDGKSITSALLLAPGLHRYTIKYLNRHQRYNLALLVAPVRGRSYILSDRALLASYDTGRLAELMAERKREEEKKAAFMRRSPELLLNGGFEIAYGNVPADWRLEGWRGEGAVCHCGLERKNRRSGQYALKIEHQGKADSRFVQEVSLREGAFYRLSGWIKCVNIPKNGGGAYLQAENTGGRTEVLFGTGDWKYVETKWKAAEDNAKVKIQCRLGDYGAPNSGTAYFDEVSLKEILPGDG